MKFYFLYLSSLTDLILLFICLFIYLTFWWGVNPEKQVKRFANTVGSSPLNIGAME